MAIIIRRPIERLLGLSHTTETAFFSPSSFETVKLCVCVHYTHLIEGLCVFLGCLTTQAYRRVVPIRGGGIECEGFSFAFLFF